MTSKIDIVIFGATGFTGKHCIPQIVKFTKNTKVTWGIAGRSHSKLKSSLEFYKNEIGKPIDTIPILIADVTDESSIREMARRSTVIINCCGPFILYGEPVVKACIEQGTHYIDVTGEMSFIEQMREKYDVKAREKDVYVISACGFDSIPADLGVTFLEKHFQGTLNSVDVYMDFKLEGDDISSIINFGTYKSLVLAIGEKFDLKELFEKSNLKPAHPLKLLPHKRDFLEGWAVPLPATDRVVINASQKSFFKDNGKRPIQIGNYAVFPSLFDVILLFMFVSVILLLCQFEFGRKLLLKYPGFFTKGFVTHENPKEGIIEKNSFTFTFYGEGWKEKETIPNEKIMAKVKGRNAGYGATCICLVQAALTVLTEREKMPKCGVISPGYAFAETSLTENLHKSGLTFEIV